METEHIAAFDFHALRENQLPIGGVVEDLANRPRVLILGDVTRDEMRPLLQAAESLFDQGDAPNLACHDDVETAVSMAVGRIPDLIIILQSWSDEYSRRDVDRLLAFAPLARIVVCYGAWCESDGRNRSIWPPAVRVPVWAASARIEKEWSLLRGAGTLPVVPLSASRDELFEFDLPIHSSWSSAQTVLVDSPDPAYRRSLIEIMIDGGHRIDNENPQIVLFDADPWDGSRAARLRKRKEEHPKSVVVALVSLPTPSVSADLLDCGVEVVRHKLGFC